MNIHIRICDYDTNPAKHIMTIRLKSNKRIFEKAFCEECANGIILNTVELKND